VTFAADPASSPRFEPLPGKAVGVLVGDPQARRTGWTGPEDAAGFACGEGGYRRVYVPCSADSADRVSLFLLVGKDGKERRRFSPIELLRRPLLKERGLDPAFQLVEVVVNEGAGSPDTDTLVASHITPLDGTRDYPLQVAPTVDKLKKRFATLMRKKAGALGTAMDREQRKVIGEKEPTGPRREADSLAVTWLPRSEELRVDLSHTLTASLSSSGKGTRRLVASRGKAGNNLPFGTTFGVEARVTYKVSKKGDISAAPLKISPVRTVVPPPPGGPQRTRPPLP